MGNGAEQDAFATAAYRLFVNIRPEELRSADKLRALIVKLSGIDPTPPQVHALGTAIRTVHCSLTAFDLCLSEGDAASLGLTADELASIRPITDRAFKRPDV
ncbi:hypothetical protein [Burkholderia cepacia]|uniref:hypothetical protein n=1 Tax=Burkholderia cepacia TaxID=292 RepID=UPI00158E9D02|nr:hypothetical protein [Burkholderia cepacia]